jgi:uncharacterized protein YciI
MIYAVLYEYSSDKEKIGAVRPDHRVHLNKLLASGNLLAAGPITDDSGALIVYQAADEQELQGFITADPFHQAGIFLRWQVKPWKVVFGNRQLLPDGGP